MKRHMKKTLLLALLLSSACSFTPDYKRPDVETPPAWSEDQERSSEIATNWWTSFKSTELDTLMQEALAKNNDLLAGLQRVQQARASLRIAGADLLPSADLTAGVGRIRTNQASGKTTSATSLEAEGALSYEVDLFGANRAGVDAADATLAASIYDQDALALMVSGDVARGYFTLLNLRERLTIADSNLKNAREVLRIIDARVKEGAESELELAQQRASVSSFEAARSSIQQQTENAKNALAVLLGKAPQSFTAKGKTLKGLAIPKIATGQPSALLERRPDLRAAEADLLAANANIGAARAAFFPTISLGLGDAVSMTGLGGPTATALSLASSLATPIFSGGRLEGGVEKATARQLELVEIYRKTVLTAFQEVEDALTAAKTSEARERSLRTAMQEARKAYDLSKNRYDAGVIDFQTLLDTQSALLSAEDSHAQAQLSRLLAAVDLYKALGGGWKI